MQASGWYKAIPIWRMDFLAEILASFHWIEPDTVHAAAISSRMLWPRIILPKVTVVMDLQWSHDIEPLLDEGESNLHQVIWNECHRIVQTAYSTGEVPTLFSRAHKAWDCLGTNLMVFVYVVQDLGDITPGDTSVLPATDDRAQLPVHVIHSGVSRRVPSDSDDFLYMSGPQTNGCGSH